MSWYVLSALLSDRLTRTLILGVNRAHLTWKLTQISKNLKLTNLRFIYRWSFLLLGLLLDCIWAHARHALIRLHRLHHLLLWFLWHRCRRLLLFWRQGQRLQVIATWFGFQMCVIKQESLLFLKAGDLAVYTYSTEPAPGKRSRVLQALEYVPWGDLLLRWHL